MMIMGDRFHSGVNELDRVADDRLLSRAVPGRNMESESRLSDAVSLRHT
jgi:hypothetical protein